ncbi:MAG: glycosyltransferase family 4 protein [Pseudomonadota bacterium]
MALRKIGSVTLIFVTRDSIPTSPELRLPDDVAVRRVRFHKRWIRPSGVPGLSLLKHACLDASPRLVSPQELTGVDEDETRGPQPFDLALYFRCDCYQIVGPHLSASRVLVDFDDIESKVIAQENALNADRSGNEFHWIGRLRAHRQAKLEDRILREVDEVLVCSEDDAAELRVRRPGASIGVVANGLTKEPEPEQQEDSATTPPSGTPSRRKPDDASCTILFVGTLSYAPNSDALHYFLKEIFPLLERASPPGPLRCLIAGPGATEAHLALAREEVAFLGRVESLTPCYQQADLAIVPIRFGGGTRIKIIEAFSYGVPVVATTLGAEGLGVRDGQELLLADEPEHFAAACRRLLTDRAYAAELSREARGLVSRKFSAHAVQSTLCQRMLGAPPTGA